MVGEVLAGPGPAVAMAEASSAAIEDVEDAESSVNLDEPQDYWEKEAVANQIANFKGNPATGDDIPMLVAVRVRPLWDKVRARPPFAPCAALIFFV